MDQGGREERDCHFSPYKYLQEVLMDFSPNIHFYP